jgi:hypothetical protein
VLNDDCVFAQSIPSVDNYCSQDGQYTNVGAAPDPTFTNTCISLQWQNGVWFSFVPREPGVLIRVFGSGNGGTLRDPKIVIFEACGDYLQCSPGKNQGIDELLVTDLTIGQRYFVMVESSVGGEGTFKLCIDDFIPTKTPESDCPEGVVLCDKSSFKVDKLESAGALTNEVSSNDCIMEEFASAWYKWTCDESGSLTFTLTPNDYVSDNKESDDLDFAVYELPGGIDDCANKKLIRCMAAGANVGIGGVSPLSTWIKCNGKTGLRDGDDDTIENAGCSDSGDDNWLSPIDMVSGKSYVLIVNNFSRSGLGFSIDWGGTGTFLGPEVDFEVNAMQQFECDKTVAFENKSTSATDPIVSYKWNFGTRSTPSSSTMSGPHDVTYSGFGDKIASLTVETTRGCLVTKIVDFFVEPCCKDTSTLRVGAQAKDLVCYNENKGRIIAQGFSGGGDYQFSIDGTNFQPNPQFNNLTPGSYNVYIYDIKGCRDTLTDVVVNQPPPIVVDAGPDQVIDLGETTFMNASFTSFNGVDTMIWSPPLDFVVNGIVNPEVFPKNTMTYLYSFYDENGCLKTDEVTIRVEKSYNIYAPNIFTPKGKANSPSNDFFNIWTTKGVKQVEVLEVYDRWGNLVYQDNDTITGGTLIPSSQTHGWDGTYRPKSLDASLSGTPVVAGVYAWRARVRFIDDFVKEFAGDITVLR